MIYSEAAYFDGNHCQHVAAYAEHRRLEAIRKAAMARRHRTPSARVLAYQLKGWMV